MEKTDRAQVVPVSFGWNDIGSWSAIWDESKRDEKGNHLMGDVVSFDTSDCYVRASERLVGTHRCGISGHRPKPLMQCWWRTKTKFKTLKKS